MKLPLLSARHAARPGGRVLRCTALLAGLALAGCASQTAVHLYTLMPSELPARIAGAPVAAADAPVIVLDPVRVPVQVDQAQWLVRAGDGTLALLEQDRWASPLPDELREALREILTRRYGAVESGVVLAPGGRLWRVHVDVSRFESAIGHARIDALWTLTPRGGAAGGAGFACRSRLDEPAEGGLPGVAAAHRRAVTRLGDAIGEQLLALQRGAAAHCPAEPPPG